jgi:hypothetical protein
MTAQLPRTNLPPQLRDLFARAQDLPDAVRDVLEATLSDAADDATPEQVVTDAFARLGYLPEEARQARLKLLPAASP